MRLIRAKLFAMTGGLIQALLAFSLLFLPVFATCIENQPCYRQSYIQLGGSWVGYTAFSLMMVLRVLVVISHIRPTFPYRKPIRWIAALSSWVVVILTAWGLGFTFFPGALMLSLAALSRHKE